MSNPNHSFSLEEVFYRRFSKKSMKYLLVHTENSTIPFTTKITLGDVALQNGRTEAWWCSCILPRQAHFDIIRAAFPSFKKVFKKLDDHQEKIECQSIMSLIEIHLKENILDIFKFDLQSFSRNKLHHRAFKNALYYLLKFIIDPKNIYDFQYAMSLLEYHLNDQDKDAQIKDICVIFTPLMGIKEIQIVQ